MFTKTAAFYDAIYRAMGKDYARESLKVHEIVGEHRRSAGVRLLDVACGTGLHLSFLRRHYEVEGIDGDPVMLSLARSRCPGVPLHRADMTTFRLGRRFDAVICLFSSIGYVRTMRNLKRAVDSMARHLEPGGVVLVEPWIAPEAFRPGRIHADFVNEPELKIARMSIGRRSGRLSLLDFHYQIGTPKAVARAVERHTLALFTRREYSDAMRDAGLKVHYDPEGLTRRGLYIGVKPLAARSRTGARH